MSLSPEMAKDLRDAREIEDMLRTPGWKRYAEILEGHIATKTKVALFPVSEQIEMDGIKQVLFGEAAKGAIMGLRLALQLPSDIVRGAESIRATLKPSDAEVTQ